MNSAQKTVAILGLAGVVVGGTSMMLPGRSSGLASRGESPAPPLGIPAGPGTSARPPASAPPPHRAAHSGFTLEARMESRYLQSGSPESHLAITLAAAEGAVRRRPALDIALVLDRSGSMAGTKLEQAKLAADRLLSQLGERDRFAIISYGTDVEVVYPLSLATEGHVSAAQRAVLSIRDDGGTNLSGGMLAAVDQLEREADGDGGRVERIVLISDGKANEGIVGAGPLAQLARDTAGRGTSVTTVGVGLDYDERVMTRMAIAGRGNYHFIETASDLRTMFQSELSSLARTAATAINLRVTPRHGVTLIDAYGRELRRQAGAYVFPIADLVTGDERKVVLRLRAELPPGGEPAAIADVRAQLHSTGEDAAIELAVAASAIITADAAKVAAHRDPDAVRHIEKAKTAIAIHRATDLYEKGRSEEARKALRQRKREAARAASAIRDAELGSALGEAADEAEANFAGAGYAPGAVTGTDGKRARKANRADAYQLAR